MSVSDVRWRRGFETPPMVTGREGDRSRRHGRVCGTPGPVSLSILTHTSPFPPSGCLASFWSYFPSIPLTQPTHGSVWPMEAGAAGDVHQVSLQARPGFAARPAAEAWWRVGDRKRAPYGHRNTLLGAKSSTRVFVNDPRPAERWPGFRLGVSPCPGLGPPREP